jgi:Tol biopolymer transport system component
LDSLRLFVVAIAVAGAACGSVASSSQNDGGADHPTGGDGGGGGTGGTTDGGGVGGTGGGAGCNLSSPFSTPMAVTELNSTASDDAISLSPDLLTAYIESNRPGGAGGEDIWVAHRTSVSAKFSAPTLLEGGVNTAANEVTPAISHDGLRLYYASGGGYALQIATRPSTAAVFSAGAPLAGINGAGFDVCPWLSADESQLYFCSVRPGSRGGADIFVADLGTNGASNVTELVAVNTTTDEENPVLTADGLTIYFSSKQLAGGGAGTDYHIWTAHRSTTADGFGQSTAVTELNSSGGDAAGWVSPDGCTIYILSSRDAGSGGRTGDDIYIATRGN